MDFVSGSYDPGNIYLFKGLGNGNYASGHSLTDKSGLKLVHSPKSFSEFMALDEKERQSNDVKILSLRAKSFGSWPTMVDYDGDEDLDLLIGTFSGGVVLRENVGTRDKPVFSDIAVPLKNGNRIIGANGCANPVATDWDNDGLWDLVISGANGSVVWFRNSGTKEKPEFERRQLLIESGHSGLQVLEPSELPKRGIRAQICVADYNGDGKKDILLGDYSIIRQLKVLSQAEAVKQEEIDERLGQLEKVVTNYSHGVYRYREPFDDAEKEAEYKKAASEHWALLEQKKPFYRYDGMTSFVWLFIRR